MGIAQKDVVNSHREIFTKYKLPHCIPKYIEPHAIMGSLRYNKKTRGGDVYMVLPETIGKAWKIQGEYGVPCPLTLIEEAVARSYKS